MVSAAGRAAVSRLRAGLAFGPGGELAVNYRGSDVFIFDTWCGGNLSLQD